MDVNLNEINDPKEIAYMLVQQQRAAALAQNNCQALEQRLYQLESQPFTEVPATPAEAGLEAPTTEAPETPPVPQA